MTERGKTRAAAWVIALAGLAAITAGMLAVRPHLDKAHVALIFLLVVLLGSAGGGRALGLVLVALAFVLFDWFFLPPYGTLIVANPLDYLVLATFLVTSIVAAQLLDRARQRADDARARTAEVARLATLGAETLNVARPEEALTAIAEVIRSTLGVDSCDVYVRGATARDLTIVATSRVGALAPPTESANGDPPGPARRPDVGSSSSPDVDSLLAWTSEGGNAAVERSDGTLRVAAAENARGDIAGDALPWDDLQDARALAIPLRVAERTVGVLRLANRADIALAPDQREFLNALSYYAALGVERLRLATEASHAEALREADRLKNALLAAVSHDLRTPLTTVKALAHAIVERGAAPGDPQAVSIEEEADRLTTLVADLLDLSRLTGGALHLRPEVNSADDLIGAALRRASGILGLRDVRVVDDGGAAILLGKFDFVHSLRALVNLIENAAKHTPAEAPIELSATRDGDTLVIAVSDRGAGVAPAERQRIFEPFYRPAGVSPDVRGAGLGLAIARGLAEAQGGDIQYAEREDGGSIFLLHLPAIDEIAVSDD